MRSNAKDRQTTSSFDCSEVGTVGLITEQRAAGRPNPRETAQCNKREMTVLRAGKASRVRRRLLDESKGDHCLARGSRQPVTHSGRVASE
jgi:hypothetical protein